MKVVDNFREIKSDLYYKVKTEDKSSFLFKRNIWSHVSNKKTLRLFPGDWVFLEDRKDYVFSERKILNSLFRFYIDKRNFFYVIAQLILAFVYLFIYSELVIAYKGAGDFSILEYTLIFFIDYIILLSPLLFMFFKLIKSIRKAVGVVGPSNGLKKKFQYIDTISFKDKSGEIRNIKFNEKSSIKEDKKGWYKYRSVEKISSNIYKMDFLVVNKDAEPLYKIEDYTLQLDFSQLKGILIPKGKKLEFSELKLKEYKTTKK